MICFIFNEDESKLLNFVDITVKNNCKGQLDFKLYCKDVITNFQIKPNSYID